MAPREGLLSTGDAQKEFGFAPQTLRRWAEERKVRYVRLPSGRFLFERADLEALLIPIEPVEPVATGSGRRAS